MVPSGAVQERSSKPAVEEPRTVSHSEAFSRMGCSSTIRRMGPASRLKFPPPPSWWLPAAPRPRYFRRVVAFVIVGVTTLGYFHKARHG